MSRLLYPSLLIMSAILPLSPGCRKPEPVPVITFMKTLGGSMSDGGHSVQQTSDGGYIIAGYVYSELTGSQDIWLIKTDASGDTLWTNTFGDGRLNMGRSVRQTSDRGYIISGFARPYGAPLDEVLLVKTDASGGMIWFKNFGAGWLDMDHSVQQTSDGGYIMAGATPPPEAAYMDVWLIKTDASGDTVWTRTLGGDIPDVGYSVWQTSDGGYIIAGYTFSYGAGSEDAWLVKTDASGEMVWNKPFGDIYQDMAHSVQQTSDGGYILAGYTLSFGVGNEDAWLIKTDASGKMVWNRTFGGRDKDIAHSVQQTSDGGYIMTGETDSYGSGGKDVWLIKTDASGNMVWAKTFGGHLDDIGWSVQQTSDGGYIVTGLTRSFGAGFYDVWLIKTDKNGNTASAN